MYLLCIDDYHLSDPLFIDQLAREMSQARPNLPPVALIHGSGEAAERALEGKGVFRERMGGILNVASAEEAAVVDRATREANQKLVDSLTDAVLPAVSIPGDARGLLIHDPEAAIGEVRAGAVAWLRQLVEQEAIPVVSALARDPETGGAREVALGVAASVLASALGREVRVVGFVRKAGKPLLSKDSDDPLPLADLPDTKAVPAREALIQVAERGHPVFLSTPRQLFRTPSRPGRLLRR